MNWSEPSIKENVIPKKKKKLNFLYKYLHSVQSLSRVWLCDTMDRSMPSLAVHHQLTEFTQTHVHWVGDAIQQSHPLFSLSPPSLVQLLKRYSQSHPTVYIINTNNKLVRSFLDKYIFLVEKECVSWHINGYSPFHYLNIGGVRPKIKTNFLAISG